MSVAPRRRRAPVAARKARDFLRNADTVLGRVIDAHPGFRWRARMDELAPLDAFGTLIFQVVGQQLSVASTRAIVARIEGLFGGRMPTPTELLAGDPQVLRTAGLSGRKGATRRALAERFVDGRLSDAGLAAMDDDEVEVALMEVPGIGQVAADPSRVREQLALTGQFAAGTSCWRAARTSSCWDAYSGSPALRPAVQRNCSSVSSSWTPPTEPRRRIPGGMRRRLDLASSMLTQPRVLFLDEPTTGRDPRSRSEIWDIVRDLRRDGTTVLLTTQYLEEADQLADQIAVIDHGQVIAKGTGNELKDRVGGHILEVELTNVGQREEARAALQRIGCGQPEQDGRPDRLTLPAPRESLVLVEEAAAELRRAGIGVNEMGLRGPTLDDVFLQLTGQAPSENGGPADAATVAAVSRVPVQRGLRLWRPPSFSLRDVRSSFND